MTLDPRQQEIYDAWCREQAALGAVPPRTAFDPIAFPRALSTLVLVERVEDDALCFRLVGTDMVEAWGGDFTGRRLDEIMEGEYHGFIRGLFDECIARRGPIFSHSRFQWDKGRALDTRRLMLPFRRDAESEDIAFILVSQVFDHGKRGPTQPIVQAGKGFEIVELEREHLSETPRS
ncbi:PAS domain-containing protein [Pelagibius sp.]|uniref:PAS domain-containing protein n=1 Tax=Pelagibius sp. TaxID=1931238 RepID=UPI003B501CBA